MSLFDTDPSFERSNTWDTKKVARIMGNLGYFNDVDHLTKYPLLVDTLTSTLSHFNLAEDQVVPCIELIEKIYDAIKLYEIDLLKPLTRNLGDILRYGPIVTWVAREKSEFPGIAGDIVQHTAYNLLNFEHIISLRKAGSRNTDLSTFGSFSDLGPGINYLNTFKNGFEA